MAQEPLAKSAAAQGVHDRFALWVDGVGGFLVCLRDSVLIGQANTDAAVDVPIRGDLSRRHLILRRQQENYFVEPLGLVSMEGRVISQRHLLRDGDELQLGSSVRLRFRQPHRLSATGRLELLSHHRFGLGDSVLLMSESCVLGPHWHNHVVCRDWQHDMVISRQPKGLMCRGMQPFEIDGQSCDGRGQLTFHSRVCGDDFCWTLEPV
jgi:FHA domain